MSIRIGENTRSLNEKVKYEYMEGNIKKLQNVRNGRTESYKENHKKENIMKIRDISESLKEMVKDYNRH
jgi:uncharacterized protein with HEPN domain